MAGSNPFALAKEHLSIKVLLSYGFDWVILIIMGIISYFTGNVKPNMRHFSLGDPNISYVWPLAPSLTKTSLAYL
jgi:hypothetical protein